MGFSIVDFIVLCLYIVAIALFGILQRGKQSSAKDYFLSYDTIPWWIVCFSIVAAETSALTFISIPGLAYATHLGFLQVTFGYLIGRVVVSFVFLPAYYKGELSTAYAFLESRFGKRTRSFASVVFLFTRVAADGVRLFATAIPLKLILGIDYVYAISILAIVALGYTYVGGVRSAIWVDAVQMFIYLGGAITAILVLLIQNGGWSVLVQAASEAGKFQFIFIDIGSNFFSKPYSLIGGIIGGAFLSMASHGTDQLVVQRVLTTKSLKASQKALIMSGVIVIIQFAMFLIVGLLLYGYYQGAALTSLGLTRFDEIFPKFIIEGLPQGISGLIVAGLLAAALSTLAGSITSLGSSTVLDLYKPYFGGDVSSDKEVKLSRWISIFWAIVLVCSALFFMNTTQTVVELALSIASFTYGGLLGTFLLGVLSKRATQKNALIAFVTGILGMILVISFKLVAWTWFTFIGVVITVTIGLLLNRMKLKPKME